MAASADRVIVGLASKWKTFIQEISWPMKKKKK